MNREESERIVSSKEGACIPCLVWARAGNMPLTDVMQGGDYDHKKSGNMRRGHMFGFCSCAWHHRRVPGEGWTHAQMTEHFGPSLMDGSRRFRQTYGTDDELIEQQTEIIKGD